MRSRGDHREVLDDVLAAVPHDDHDVLRVKGRDGGQHMPEE